METSDTQLSFLDVMINKEGKKVFMDIHSKPTDLKKICLLQLRPPQTLLEKYYIFSCSQNLNDC